MKHVSILVLALALSACAMTQEQSGTLTGAAVGAVVGNSVGGGGGRVLGTGLGAIIGGAIGGNVGRHMDSYDQRRATNIIEHTPTGHGTTWQNPDNGNIYTIRPNRTYQRGNVPCREYSTSAIINNRVQNVQGIACRQPDGTWRAQ